MQKQSSKSESTRKTEQNRSGWNFLTMGQSQRSTVKVNGQSQRSTDDVCWRGSVTSPRLMWQDAKRSRRVESVGRVGLAREARGGYWRRVGRVGLAREARGGHNCFTFPFIYLSIILGRSTHWGGAWRSETQNWRCKNATFAAIDGGIDPGGGAT